MVWTDLQPTWRLPLFGNRNVTVTVGMRTTIDLTGHLPARHCWAGSWKWWRIRTSCAPLWWNTSSSASTSSCSWRLPRWPGSTETYVRSLGKVWRCKNVGGWLNCSVYLLFCLFFPSSRRIVEPMRRVSTKCRVSVRKMTRWDICKFNNCTKKVCQATCRVALQNSNLLSFPPPFFCPTEH